MTIAHMKALVRWDDLAAAETITLGAMIVCRATRD